ncbi:hypothetical protein DU80_17910 [Methanosarcina mazei]|uniref:Uncharacterized protein n=1 Tax=Methanosarcina mazei TaxID=2209 RepID=A0A0F8K0E6_METMZ|nr:hypothetical protein DU47_14260 [Methanosarcina mazei]KKG50766.1 hypothetical protein DU33_08475 [Methanosarcina mazei]KKG74854.1 hypothetical protein DU63_04595 [Methanosarcina mazei]KKH07878.1 hypothetical protein DU42_02125 [Methanosarcina mazei]KKH62582.1 hypothetical protein DU74_07920 [Methanosarcina mazei]
MKLLNSSLSGIPLLTGSSPAKAGGICSGFPLLINGLLCRIAWSLFFILSPCPGGRSNFRSQFSTI